jgi:hypothetical protein
MMVACGRRCCLCRRFKPTKLQVHHIDERAAGGGDEWDNLIALCLTCHTDVHSKVPFTRRFTHPELKGHRDSLLARVAAGDFDPNEPDDYDPSILAARTIDADGLSKEAVELLLTAAAGQSSNQGMILITENNTGTGFFAGNSNRLNPFNDNRRTAEYKRGLSQLVDRNLVEYESPTMYMLTIDGYLLADELAAKAVNAGDSLNVGIQESASVRIIEPSP